MERLHANKIRALVRRLSEPHAQYSVDGVRFEIYRAKDMLSRYWNSTELKQLALCARCSYSKYGVRSLLDPYDDKAAIYLVRVIYPSPENRHCLINEWLSIRMVPGHGKPIGGGELEIYTYRSKSMAHWLRHRHFSNHGKGFWNYVASSSRMCGIHPYTQELRKGNRNIGRLSVKHKHTAICFALIHVRFLVDYPPTAFPYRYVTAIIRSELAMRGLRFKRNGQEFGPTFTSAHETLGLDRNQIKLDRGVYAYEFPIYWFDVPMLKKVLRDLISQGRLPKRDHITLRNLGNLLTTDAKIPGSNLTGRELRRIVDKNVSDVPELKITEGYTWYKSLNDTLRIVGIDVPGATSIIDSYHATKVVL